MRKFGYLLGDDSNGVLVMRKNRVLIPLNSKKMNQKNIYLRQTMFRLLEFLLERGNSGLLRDEIIMRAVWEGYGLKSSAPRLWQVMSELRKKLSVLGADNDFIMRVEGQGYMVNAAGYEPVYIRASYDRFNRFFMKRSTNTEFAKSVK
ncbi:winged helix-turn-helix domain-containing protein [Raoultella planticola]|uniref:winged helix-turn-helix domain-containing protein n=1 Tax=Raoultella planticola TaxID=575 RepID=UPI000BA03CA7|nr:winged helix-turn-helix domain-containing protein [Raoultella planticola]EKW3527066.1 winged helix-turn-helix domain-containing protein [Raoultella planticola]ELF4969415.1 winged helix-turn-helix domain-containing protein [Raoultella planticola]MCD9605248.1 winged helix-turn-helix domain-containing protein [Raoultella planticola]MDM9658713.1 winged helix-turn-helix domain-containing protein [Raoultella planticola]MDM9663816.1 winged helix-turn-helix domain-containing protein [Raoultella pla